MSLSKCTKIKNANETEAVHKCTGDCAGECAGECAGGRKVNPQIRLDPRNARLHVQRSKDAIRESLRTLGAGRSILIDSENVMIGGEGVYGEAQALGLPVRIIESDGRELIAIRRTDLKTDDEKRKALAIADNRTGDLSFFDDEIAAELLKECEGFELAAGFTESELAELNGLHNILDDLQQNAFANEIKAASDVFSITFLFSKSAGEAVPAYIREFGKDALTDHIVMFCRKEVESCQDAVRK